MKKEISLQELIAYNSTPKAKALIVKYGYSPARNINQLIDKLYLFTKEHKQDALMELTEIHPHKDLILNLVNPKESDNSSIDEKCSCSNCLGTKKSIGFSSFDGEEPKKNTNVLDYVPMILLAGIISITFVALSKTNL